MDNKEAIIQATIKLIEEKGEHLEEVTVREICKRAGVGLGLVNPVHRRRDRRPDRGSGGGWGDGVSATRPESLENTGLLVG